MSDDSGPGIALELGTTRSGRSAGAIKLAVQGMQTSLVSHEQALYREKLEAIDHFAAKLIKNGVLPISADFFFLRQIPRSAP